MSWKNTGRNVYQRPCDASERFMKEVSLAGEPHNREHWCINVLARIEPGKSLSETLVSQLQKAWTILRFQHPFIAATLDNNILLYKVPDEQELAGWLSDSFFVEDGNVDDFLLSVRSRTYSSLHLFPQTSELVLRLHHWLIDGIGSIHLLNAFLKNLASKDPVPQFGKEWRRLAPSFTETADLPREYSPENEKVGMEMIQSIVDGGPSIGLPLKSALEDVGGARRRKVEFGEALTSDILRACKQKGFSVASAINAATIVSTQILKADIEHAKNYAGLAVYNYRPYNQAPYNDADTWPMGCYIFAIPFSSPPGDFVTHAADLQKRYRQPLKKEENPYFVGWSTFTTQMTSAMGGPPPPGVPPQSNPMLSSLGKLDGRIHPIYYGAFDLKLLEAEIVVDQLLPYIIVYQWSFQGKLSISTNYNGAFHEDSAMEEFLREVKKILVTELGVVDGEGKPSP